MLVTMIITALDKKIIYELFKNGRASNSAIAKKVLSSKEVVGYRLKRMSEKGILKNVAPIIDYSKLGYHTYRVQLKLHSITPTMEDELLTKCMQIPHISWIVDLSGPWELVLLFLCKNPNEFARSLKHTYNLFGEYIIDKSTSIIQNIHYFVPDVIAPTQLVAISGEKCDSLKLHESEEKIIKQLITNGRKSILDIAKETNMSAINATHHLKQLLKKEIIIGFQPVLDYSKLELDHFKVMLKLRDLNQTKQCFEYISKYLHPLYITQAISSYDVEFEMLFSSYREAYAELEKIKEVISIQDTQIMLTKDERLLNALPHTK